MKLFFHFFTLLILLLSCQSDKPQRFLDKDQMADIIVDFALYDQSYMVNPQIAPEEAHRFVLEKHKISPKDFKENYAYYLKNTSDLEDIFDKAQEKIKLLKEEKRQK